jgi:hypothetical protein
MYVYIILYIKVINPTYDDYLLEMSIAVIFLVFVVGTINYLPINIKNTTPIIFLLVTSLFYYEITNLLNAISTERNPRQYVNLTLQDNRNVVTNDNFYFIGATKNYYFFRNRVSQNNIIIPSSEVKEVRMRKLKREIKKRK